MTSERNKCGLTSLLPLSCRDHAEAFARSLQSRLSSLGSQNSAEERSWLGSNESTIALSQPLHNPETERYLALEMLESPCSPQDEISERELHQLWNRGSSLKEKINGDCHCLKLNGSEVKYNGRSNGLVRHYSGDSDNEVFYDLDDDPPNHLSENVLGHSESSRSIESETGIDVNSQGTSSSNPSETFATSLDCTPQPSVSDDISTLSLADDSSLVEADSICVDCETNRETTLNKNVRNFETDSRNKEKDEGYVNEDVISSGADDSDRYITNLSTQTEFVVEYSTDPELDKDGEEESSGSYENGDSSETKLEDNDDQVIPRVRRCSSLKTGKTPPGTPGRKKIVRFADVLGLDLADVRTFLDEVPKVPKSAYDDLSDVDLLDAPSDLNFINIGTKFHGIKTERILVPLFEQPAGMPNFLDLVRDNQVCLENALVEDPILFLIKGTVRVRNLDFHKSVHIRYTLDSWKTYADVQATYVNNSCDGFSDRFSFTIYAHTLTVGQKIEFACRFQCKGCQYWDNNGGRNYRFQCLPSATSNTATPVLASHGLADFGASFY